MKKILLMLPLVFWLGCEDDKPPSAVDLTFKVIGTNVILEWTKNSDGDFDSYEIVENGPFGDTTIYNTTDNNSTLFLRQGANSCEYYHYEVVVTNESGKSTSSNTAEVFTGPAILFEAEQNNYYQIARLDSDGEAIYLTALIDQGSYHREINYSIYDDNVYFLTHFGSEYQIARVSILGGEIETVYEDNIIHDLAISDNGKRLGFISDGYLTYLDIETGDVNQIGNYSGDFAINYDGTSFAVSDQNLGIRAVDENGSVTELITNVDTDFMDWSADGNTLVFHFYYENNYEIGTVEKDGSNFLIVTNQNNYYRHPTFINSDTQIMFVESNDRLKIVNAGGGGEVTVADDVAGGDFRYYSVSECLSAVVYRHSGYTLLAVAYYSNLLSPEVAYTSFIGGFPRFLY